MNESKAPTLAQVRAFVAVADQLHFGDAADALGVSQPALSAAVSALESHLGVQLVERTTRRVLLTPEGQSLLEQARAVVAAVDALVDEASGQRALSGRLRIGVIPTVAPYLLPSLLRSMRRRMPELSPEVREEQTHRLLGDLAAARIDVAVLALPSGASGVAELPLYDEDFVLAVPPGHRLAGATGLPPTALRRQELLLLDEGHCLRDQALDLCRSARALGSVSSAARASSLGTVVQLVGAGLGATLLPEMALAAETRRAPLGVARFAPPAPGRRIGLAFRSTSARAPAYPAVAVALRAAVARLPVRVIGPD
jgi:LysR family transcriptional regulator, hydrogen peroxide-inducible genes activator